MVILTYTCVHYQRTTSKNNRHYLVLDKIDSHLGCIFLCLLSVLKKRLVAPTSFCYRVDVLRGAGICAVDVHTVSPVGPPKTF